MNLPQLNWCFLGLSNSQMLLILYTVLYRIEYLLIYHCDMHLQNLIWSAGHSGDLLLVCTLWHFWQDNLRTRLSTGTHQLSKTLQLTTCKAGIWQFRYHATLVNPGAGAPTGPMVWQVFDWIRCHKFIAAHTFKACLSKRSWLQFTWSHTSWNVDQHEIYREFTCFHKNEDEELLFMQSKDRPCAEIYKLHSVGN